MNGETENEVNFIERADELDLETLLTRTVDNAFFANIRSRLLGGGAKLLIGPRGTGKTHQMRYVHKECLQDADKPAAIYSSFTRYVRLEPLITQTSDAQLIFYTWVVAKIASSGFEFLTAIGKSADEVDQILVQTFQLRIADLIQYVNQIESRGSSSGTEPPSTLTIGNLHEWFDQILAISGRTRIILLLDDAALSMTPEYLVEFFNIFQDLKSAKVAPKASVYPGTSQYGPRLHLRHDVQPINAWLSIEDPTYNETMDQLLRAWDINGESFPDGVLDLFKYAAFGVPRVFGSLLRSYKEREWGTVQQGVNNVIEEQVELMEAEYQSLALKVPQFKSVIAAGDTFFKNVVDTMSGVNRALANTDEKQLTLGVPVKEVSVLHGRMIRFLIEVGFLYPLSSVKHGEDRVYMRYIPHLAPLIHSRAFQTGSGFSARSQVAFIAREKKSQPQRISMTKLVPDNDLKLDLAKCTVCHTSRLSESQKFCHSCGSVLVNSSAFEACMSLPISKLPITTRQKDALKAAGFHTIGDIIATQDPTSELRSPGVIGPRRSANIVEKAQRYVDDYFS